VPHDTDAHGAHECGAEGEGALDEGCACTGRGEEIGVRDAQLGEEGMGAVGGGVAAEGWVGYYFVGSWRVFGDIFACEDEN
jgi:hypothetical protein